MKLFGLIYVYTYLPTGEKYIGQTVNFEKRQKEHLTEKRTNLRFHNLLRKHYEDFAIEVLEDNIPITFLNEREKYWIQHLNTCKGFGFNLTEGGDGGYQACKEWWCNHPEELYQHLKHIQPLAVEAAKEWRKNNPELERQRIQNLHQKSAEWREQNKEKFLCNLNKAQQQAKLWREAHPEEFKANRKKATQATSKPVECITTGEKFISASEAGRIKKIPASNISGCCRGVRKSAGKNKEGKKLIWRYIDE